MKPETKAILGEAVAVGSLLALGYIMKGGNGKRDPTKVYPSEDRLQHAEAMAQDHRDYGACFV